MTSPDHALKSTLHDEGEFAFRHEIGKFRPKHWHTPFSSSGHHDYLVMAIACSGRMKRARE
jgi:hypothetical protein